MSSQATLQPRPRIMSPCTRLQIAFTLLLSGLFLRSPCRVNPTHTLYSPFLLHCKEKNSVMRGERVQDGNAFTNGNHSSPKSLQTAHCNDTLCFGTYTHCCLQLWQWTLMRNYFWWRFRAVRYGWKDERLRLLASECY